MDSEELNELLYINSKEVLSVREAALFLGKSEKTIRNRLDEIPHYRGGNGIVFKREELIAWQCQVRCEPISL